MRNPTEVLKSLTEKSKDESYRFQRLYRNLYNPEFYWLAYKNIYANKGSMTAGADRTTIDGMSDERINGIIHTQTIVTVQSLQSEYILRRKTAIKSVRWVSSRAMTSLCRKS